MTQDQNTQIKPLEAIRAFVRMTEQERATLQGFAARFPFLFTDPADLTALLGELAPAPVVIEQPMPGPFPVGRSHKTIERKVPQAPKPKETPKAPRPAAQVEKADPAPSSTAEAIAAMDPEKFPGVIANRWNVLACERCNRDFIYPRMPYGGKRPELCFKCLEPKSKARRLQVIADHVSRAGHPYPETEGGAA